MLVVFLFYVHVFKDVNFLAKHKVGNICIRDNNMSLLPYTKPRSLREKGTKANYGICPMHAGFRVQVEWAIGG
jgi:hypothetical protein